MVPSVSVRTVAQTLKRQMGTFKNTILMCVVFESEDTNHINAYDGQAEKTMTSCMSSVIILTWRKTRIIFMILIRGLLTSRYSHFDV